MQLRPIIKEHLLLFKDSKYQYVVFYIYPLLIAIGLAFLKVPERALFEQMNVAVSILTSAMFAMLGMLTSKNLTISDEDVRKRAANVIKETINSIVFVVLLNVILMILCVAVVSVYPIDNNIIYTIIRIFVYYIFIVVLLNILLIVKRLRRILEL